MKARAEAIASRAVRGFYRGMDFLRSVVWLAVLVSLTFALVVFFKHGPGDATEFADGVRQEIAGMTSTFRELRERLPDAPFVAPES